MALAGIYNQTADQGATYGRLITLYDSAGNPLNLTGYTAKMQIRETYDSPTAILELSTSNGKIVLGGALGTVTLTAAAADMNFTAEQYVYDLEITSGAGVITRVIMGTFDLRAEVTR